MLGLVAISVLFNGLCPSAAAQAKSPQSKSPQNKSAADKPAAGKAAPEKPVATETALLTIGSKAPPIDIEHWISNGNGKFKPVTKFVPGKVYVVEFWATWCGPCIASMPHLAETQAKYADKGVQIISISDEDLETVQGFLATDVRSSKPVDSGEAGEGEGKKSVEKNAKVE